MKWLGSLLVITACTGMGILAGNRKKQRLKQLKELMLHLKVLYGEIEYGRTALPEVMRTVATRNQGDISILFEKTADELEELKGESFSSIWNRCVEGELKGTCLEKKDRLLLTGLGENLGFLDQNMQLRTISHYMMNLEEIERDAILEIKDKVRLYNMLGVLFGLFLTIIMI